MTFHSVGNFIIPTDELHHFSEGLVNHQPLVVLYLVANFPRIVEGWVSLPLWIPGDWGTNPLKKVG